MMTWPDNRRFAFTIFDDPDSQTLEAGRAVYAFLEACGLRTTKGVWPIRGTGTPSDFGVTCADPGVVDWLQDLTRRGFEMGYHNATSHTSRREDVDRSLEQFAAYFGHYPRVMANHYFCDEKIYWNEHRVTGAHRLLYNVMTLARNRHRSFGHVRGHPYFWGDLCRQRIEYVRNFSYADINTLKVCPVMPYHDPRRPYVNYWYAASEGANVRTFIGTLSEANQDRLEEEGGACIVYAHFGHGFSDAGRLNPRFRSLVERLSAKKGWFVPVSTLLDHLRTKNPMRVITDARRRQLERRWLLHKVRFGTE
jgi:hypothetical protein